MKIGIHCDQFDGRGTGKVPYDYGIGLKNLGHEVMFITSGLSANEGLSRIASMFPVKLYDGKAWVGNSEAVREKVQRIVDEQKLNFLYMIKAGENDHITPLNCKTGIHCVFAMREPHGDVYAGVSETLARKFGYPTKYVPHIIKNLPPTKNLRAELNIPEERLVIGRHGGINTFDLPFVYEAIAKILEVRKDLHFLFLSTREFIKHERVIFIPWVNGEQEIFNFIHACDAMLHARASGETFGLAVGEFAVANKPVITWSGKGNPYYDVAHIEHLQGRALTYSNYDEVLEILRILDKPYILSNDWDTFSTQFDEKSVMTQYTKIFLT
jgi:glycosyltransferase involved in cell wall biosynthesis